MAYATRWLILATVAFGCVGPVARAADPAPDSAQSVAGGDVAASDQAAIQRVIEKQFEAFRDDDGPTAMAQASPNIRSMFGNDPDTFMSMVRKGYQPVYRPRSVTFGAIESGVGGVTQRVDVIGPDGVPHTALYSMERQSDGVWKISGCTIVDANAVGA